MAVTHSDLLPKPQTTKLSTKKSITLIISTLLSGLFCFILCLIAESTRSVITKKSMNECVYNGSGKMPLLCAAIAFVGLAVVMVVEHLYLLIAVSEMLPPAPAAVMVSWQVDSSSARNLTWHAGFFFAATWICFAIVEILLLIGMSVESEHLKNWSKPKPNCLILRRGIFSSAGIFALLTVFFAAGLYLTALRAEKIFRNLENVRRPVLEPSAFYASPPENSPEIGTMNIARENSVVRENPLFDSHLRFHKA